jgi:hypothetical protein
LLATDVASSVSARFIGTNNCFIIEKLWLAWLTRSPKD